MLTLNADLGIHALTPLSRAGLEGQFSSSHPFPPAPRLLALGLYIFQTAPSRVMGQVRIADGWPDTGSGVNTEDPLEHCISTQLPFAATSHTEPGDMAILQSKSWIGGWGKGGLKFLITMEVNNPCLPLP